jgi:hypothetical protein
VAIYSGDPGSGTGERWGDTMAVRGSGANTEILVGSRNGTNFAIINPNTLAVTLISVDAANDSFGLGLAFGAGNTFYAKVNQGLLHHIDYSGAILHAYTNFALPISVIGVSTSLGVLAGNAIENPDNLRLYSLADLNANPPPLDFAFYRHPSKFTGFGTGDIDFSSNRVFGLDENNGIIAWQVASPKLEVSLVGGNVVLNWNSALPFRLRSSTNVDGPYTDLPGPVTSPPYTNTSPSATMFFQLGL